jgi:hypothetical protein
MQSRIGLISSAFPNLCSENAKDPKTIRVPCHGLRSVRQLLAIGTQVWVLLSQVEPEMQVCAC